MKLKRKRNEEAHGQKKQRKNEACPELKQGARGPAPGGYSPLLLSPLLDFDVPPASETVHAWLENTCIGYAARFGPAFTSIGASRMCEVVSWLAMLQEDGYSKLRSSMLTSRPHAEAAVEHALKQLRAYAAAVDTSLSSSSSSQQLL